MYKITNIIRYSGHERDSSQDCDLWGVENTQTGEIFDEVDEVSALKRVLVEEGVVFEVVVDEGEF